MKNLLFTLIPLCLIIASCQFKTAEAPEIDFTDYYFYINSAMLAQEQDSVEAKNAYLWKAYRAFPEQDKVPIYDWLIGKLIPTYALGDSVELIKFIKKHKICTNEPSRFMYFIPKEYKAITTAHATFVEPPIYYHNNYQELQVEIDTIDAIDLYIRGVREKIDTTLIEGKYKSLNMREGDSIVLNKLQRLHKKYGYFGTTSCKKYTNLNIIRPYVHISNHDNFNKINDYLLEILRMGYITPNEYAWAFDRSYSQKFGTFYYYFCLTSPIYTTNHIPINQLSEAQKNEINERRRKIGLAPLPHSFSLIEAYNL